MLHMDPEFDSANFALRPKLVQCLKYRFQTRKSWVLIATLSYFCLPWFRMKVIMALLSCENEEPRVSIS